MARNDAYRKFVEGKTFKEVQTKILEAVPMICDDICELISHEKLSKSDTLDGVFNLLKFAGTGQWRPQSEVARQALPKIAAFLSSMASNDTAKLRHRMRATAYLLQGAELTLWALPKTGREKIALYIRRLFQVKL